MIEVDDVELAFGDVTVLDGVDPTVERGEFVAVVGPNGAGKTTLLRTINGLVDPDAGAVRVDGDRVAELSAKAVSRQVATVPQDTHVGFSFSAEQVVEMGRTPHRSRLDWSDDQDPVDRALERTEVVHLRERPVDDLSGGERQRVLLARALAQEPAALVLDEPTANLDINHQISVLDIVAELVAEGKTALAAIHDLDLAARYCDRLLVLFDGEIRASGPPEDVLTDEALTAAFDTEAAVTTNPATGTPTVTAVDRPERSERIHVVGGGTNARQTVSTLWQAGFSVSLGPVPDGDAAAAFAEEVDCRTVTAPPFQAIPEQRRAAAHDLASAAGVVVDAGSTGDVVDAVTDGHPVVRATLGEEPAQARRRPAAIAQDGGRDETATGTLERTAETPAELLRGVEDCLDGREQ